MKSPYILAAVSAVLSLATGAAFAVQVANAGAAQISGLAMQGGMSLMWGAMALRFYNRGRVARRRN